MKKILFLILMSFSIVNTYSAEDALKYLETSDLARGGLEEGLEWDITIKGMEDGESSERKFSIKARGNDSLAEAVSPERNKGEVFLFNDRTMWFFKPSMRKPISISARQRLTGQAANGDIATTNYSRDYIPTIEREEKINGEATKVLMLKSKEKNTTYDQIRYWVSVKSGLALKAEFLTLQGKVFKIATFEYNNKITYKGKTFVFVSKMTIKDAVNENNISELIYGQATPGKFSTSIFNVNNLTR